MTLCNCMCGDTPICVACGTDEKVRRFETVDGPVHLCRECAIAREEK